MSNTFDYVKYDGKAHLDQNKAKELVEQLEVFISGLDPSRARSLAITKLEEVYMWIGKAIRDEQVARVGEKVELEEGRKDG